MSNKRLDVVGDFIRHGYTLRVDCRGCGRLRVFDPIRIVELCQRNGWSRQTASVEQRFVCAKCGSKDVRLGPGFQEKPGGP